VSASALEAGRGCSRTMNPLQSPALLGQQLEVCRHLTWHSGSVAWTTASPVTGTLLISVGVV